MLDFHKSRCEFNIVGKVKLVRVSQTCNSQPMVIVKIAYHYRDDNQVKEKVITVVCFSPVNVIAAQLKTGDQVFVNGRLEDRKVDLYDYPVTTSIAQQIIPFPQAPQLKEAPINVQMDGEVFV